MLEFPSKTDNNGVYLKNTEIKYKKHLHYQKKEYNRSMTTTEKINMFEWVDKNTNHGGVALLARSMPKKNGKQVSYDTLYHNFKRARENRKAPSAGVCSEIAKGMTKILGRKVTVEDLSFHS